MSEPLAQLAWEEKWEALKAALCAGHDPNAVAELYDPHGRGKRPPLYCAARKGAPRSILDLLAAKGADVCWANENGYTALHMAAQGGHVEVIRALYGTHGADLNAQGSAGYTPLHVAARNAETAAVKVFLELGADASLRANNDRTALGHADEEGDHETAQLLRDHAAAFGALGQPPQGAPQFPTGGAAGAPAPAPTPTPTPYNQAVAATAVVAHPPPAAPPAAEPAAVSLAQAQATPPELDAWLVKIGLAAYTAAIKEYAYTQISILLVAEEEDIVEMFADPDLKMKKPHQRAFLAAWKELMAEAGGASGSSTPLARRHSAPPAAADPPAAAPAAKTTESHGKTAGSATDTACEYDLVFSNKTAWDHLCLDTRSQLVPTGVRVWQQRTDIPKDSENCKHTRTFPTTTFQGNL